MTRLLLSLAAALALLGCSAPSRPATAADPATPAVRVWSGSALADLRAAAAAAPEEGFAPQAAALARIESLELKAATDARAASDLDEAADALFSRLAHDFAQGAVDPASVDATWLAPRRPAPDVAAVRAAALAPAASPGAILRALLPQRAEYAALRAEYARVVAEPVGATDAAGRTRETRIARLRANLERLRWLPEPPARRIEVRTPFFDLLLHRAGTAPQAHAVVVGARDMPTPSLVDTIGSVTFNPTWTPPASIIVNELLPRFRRDPGAAAREGFDVLDASGVVVAPDHVDWGARPFPYTLRQRSGPANALGGLRFDTSNPYAIFLHDTPNRTVFSRAARALSHGCIRVADPHGLAEAVFADPAWTRAAIETAIAGGVTQKAPVPVPMPLIVLYLTAATDASGAVIYADDVYGRDARVLRALDAAGPARRATASPLSYSDCGAAAASR
jgi:murein L,D-transpeptidase YcbB/YkuD